MHILVYMWCAALFHFSPCRPLQHCGGVVWLDSAGHLCITTVHASSFAVHRSCYVKVHPTIKCLTGSSPERHPERSYIWSLPTPYLCSRACSGSGWATLTHGHVVDL
ncbi:hypothetical protein B0H19DRAFT_1134478, partial [Mycena capillaripes]